MQTDPQRRYLCRHVHTNGHRCGSPALRAQNFCYYHDRTRLPNAPLAGRIGIFKMQPIDDRDAIQIALYDVLSRITAGDIDTKRAAILLYGLQIASSNLTRRDKLQPATNPIEHITSDHLLGDLAPIEEIPTQQPTSSDSVIPSEAQPTPPPCVIPSEARSAQPRDPRICDATKSESEPTPSDLDVPLTLAAVHAAGHPPPCGAGDHRSDEWAEPLPGDTNDALAIARASFVKPHFPGTLEIAAPFHFSDTSARTGCQP
ncbi:MAG TPA: hypothetical protein VHU44_08655 [Acidobacteriaceae bacterium]|nr:hypothetical protein [Acidobacteriaceae bacterium]